MLRTARRTWLALGEAHAVHAASTLLALADAHRRCGFTAPLKDARRRRNACGMLSPCMPHGRFGGRISFQSTEPCRRVGGCGFADRSTSTTKERPLLSSPKLALAIALLPAVFTSFAIDAYSRSAAATLPASLPAAPPTEPAADQRGQQITPRWPPAASGTLSGQAPAGSPGHTPLASLRPRR